MAAGRATTDAEPFHTAGSARAQATSTFSPHLVPTGLDENVDWLIPELRERNSYPTEYAGTTLSEHLGLRPPLTWWGRVADDRAAAMTTVRFGKLSESLGPLRIFQAHSR